ncbi:MAG: diguanylate cyclase [Candidatus Aminicenantes bacterium]|nr:diguanylate cyclase [Candidatus Aminicenantes bacterium]
MQKEKQLFPDIDDPQELAADLVISKNRWLTRSRALYTLFIFIFFIAYAYFSGAVDINLREILLTVMLSLLGNLLFILVLKRSIKISSSEVNRGALSSLTMLQLDFDLVVLALLIFFSGGFESPLLVFFVFYIVMTTFLVEHKKALKNTLAAIALVAGIFLTHAGFRVSSKDITSLVGFGFILLFTYLVSAYLSQSLRENERKLRELLEKFREQSVTDGLTGLYNQTHFFLLFNLQLERARRYRTALSLIIFDVDYFKNYNDSNGHIAGSAALKKVGQLTQKVFRASDILSKYGGDEFVIILPNSDKIGAFLGAERLRETVEHTSFEGGETQPLGKVTLSLGIASYPEHGVTTKDILDRADKAMYVAKESGRNKTVIYSPDLEEISVD